MLDVLSPEGAAVSHDTKYLARNGVSTHQGDNLLQCKRWEGSVRDVNETIRQWDQDQSSLARPRPKPTRPRPVS